MQYMRDSGQNIHQTCTWPVWRVICGGLLQTTREEWSYGHPPPSKHESLRTLTSSSERRELSAPHTQEETTRLPHLLDCCSWSQRTEETLNIKHDPEFPSSSHPRSPVYNIMEAYLLLNSKKEYTTSQHFFFNDKNTNTDQIPQL